MTLSADLRRYNDSLDDCLSRRYHMSLRTFKFIKAMTQLVGAAAGVYAMSLGAPPLAALALISVMVSGPEVMEQLIESSG
jgi:hypothetical protein